MNETQTTNTRSNSIISIILGVIMVLLGLAAFGTSMMAGTSGVSYLGALFAIGGAVQIIFSLLKSFRSHMFLGLFVGIMYFLVGLIMLGNPTLAIMAISLFLSLFFMINGLYKIVMPAIDRYHNWGWVFFNGIISFLFGLALWVMAPIDLMLISAYAGIELILWGISYFVSPFAMEEMMHQGSEGGMHHLIH